VPSDASKDAPTGGSSTPRDAGTPPANSSSADNSDDGCSVTPHRASRAGDWAFAAVLASWFAYSRRRARRSPGPFFV
jgi:hypothetical protein